MDISNSLVQTGFQKPVETSRNLNRDTAEKNNDPLSQSPSRQAEPIDSDLLAKVSDERNEVRVQRVEAIESAPLRTQQAVNSYQQTIDASQEYEEGELVGIDLFV